MINSLVNFQHLEEVQIKVFSETLKDLVFYISNNNYLLNRSYTSRLSLRPVVEFILNLLRKFNLLSNRTDLSSVPLCLHAHKFHLQEYPDSAL